jgi:hypothetical protein
MNLIEEIRTLRNEFGCGLVEAKRMVEKYGSATAARAALQDGGLRGVETDVERLATLSAERNALASALRRAEGAIHGLLNDTPIRDLDETLAEIESLIGKRFGS